MSKEPEFLRDLAHKNLLTHHQMVTMGEFFRSYMHAVTLSGSSQEEYTRLFMTLTHHIIEQIQHAYSFEVFHEALRTPFDYYQFGIDFIRPLIDKSKSLLRGVEHFQNLIQQTKQGDNVILFANHQTEPDPQIMSLLLESIDPLFASQIIFVAGHRVVKDPMAIPFSLGRRLLCIHSKRHIHYPPEEKESKRLHNQRTMKKLGELLSQGGQCIYVAPSGGRDRLNAEGEVSVAPFDSQSIELFRLMAQQSDRPTHFYPLTLKTYHLMPPPKHVERELGERRVAYFSPVGMAIDQEFDMDNFSDSLTMDKRTKKTLRAESIWSIVEKNYAQLTF